MSAVYLAARYARRLEMVARRAELIEAGHECTSRWIDGAHESLDSELGPVAGEWAADDIADISRSDCLVMFTDEPGELARGGRHVEFGYALGFIPVAIVGRAENVFHWHDEVQRFETWADCLAAIPRIAA